MSEWSFYFPGDGENANDAVPIISNFQGDACWAAEEACEYDLSCREGNLHIGEPFAIAVISPEGKETRWIGEHEATVLSAVRKMEQK